MKTESELMAYKNTKSDFVDYTSFEDGLSVRSAERNAFIGDIKYTPDYKYPRFERLIFKKHKSIKHNLYEAVLQLDASKQNPVVNAAETELYARSLELRLKRIMLVESAMYLADNAISISSNEVDRQSFAKMNEVLHGNFDTQSYIGMISTEKDRLNNFVPKSDIANTIKSQLELLLGRIDTKNQSESPMLNESEMNKLHNFVANRYADILTVVPDTSDDLYYDVSQCVEIINWALSIGGLSDFGWKAVENPDKTNPATNQTKKRIYLPSNTSRNAAELRRLIIHEQEVHARRIENAGKSGIKPIISGTAGYSDAEEGLGVLLECAVDGSFNNASYDRSRNRYITAGLALGSDYKPRDAREVYETLWRIISVQDSIDGNISDTIVQKSKNKAYTLVENAYRGTQFWMKGVIYTKLKVYYEGLAKNAEYFKQNIDNLDQAFDDAFIGRYNHTDSTERELVKSLAEHK